MKKLIFPVTYLCVKKVFSQLFDEEMSDVKKCKEYDNDYNEIGPNTIVTYYDVFNG